MNYEKYLEQRDGAINGSSSGHNLASQTITSDAGVEHHRMLSRHQ